MKFFTAGTVVFCFWWCVDSIYIGLTGVAHVATSVTWLSWLSNPVTWVILCMLGLAKLGSSRD